MLVCILTIIFFPFSQLASTICSLFIGSCCFQLHIPLIFRDTQSNSTPFMYCGKSPQQTPLFLLIFHSSLLSTNYLCCLTILFSARSLPEDKLLANSLHRAGKVLFIQFYNITHVLYQSCQYWLFELDYKFLINQCLSTLLFKGVIHMENFCHNSNNNFRHFLFLNCLIKKVEK